MGIVKIQCLAKAIVHPFPLELKETEFHTPLAGILLGSPGRGPIAASKEGIDRRDKLL